MHGAPAAEPVIMVDMQALFRIELHSVVQELLPGMLRDAMREFCLGHAEGEAGVTGQVLIPLTDGEDEGEAGITGQMLIPPTAGEDSQHCKSQETPDPIAICMLHIPPLVPHAPSML